MRCKYVSPYCVSFMEVALSFPAPPRHLLLPPPLPRCICSIWAAAATAPAQGGDCVMENNRVSVRFGKNELKKRPLGLWRCRVQQRCLLILSCVQQVSLLPHKHIDVGGRHSPLEIKI
jgi:hypothetical protein